MIAFNDGWTVVREGDGDEIAVRLPHDAMLAEGRRADAPSGSHGAYHLGGRYLYRKRWLVPAYAGKELILLFEGVYRHATVRVDGVDLGGWSGGYDEFEVRIDAALAPGAEAVIEVAVDNAHQPSARWYTGSGIYRPVWLRVLDPCHFLRDGVRFRTVSLAAEARAEVAVTVANPQGTALQAVAELRFAGGVVARAERPVIDGAATLPLAIAEPRSWSADSPQRYELIVTLSADGTVRDERRQHVGLRTIAMSGRDGLRVNGAPVLLRGGNLHHDNGVLGAATHRDAEFRRARLLKAAGYNAIRSAHHPISRALLDACDGLGLYVVDELFDGWYDRKAEHDDADRFVAVWRDAADAMVAKDRNHPCVILYSVGNENSEPTTAHGIATAHRLADQLRALDPTRGVTIGVNLMAAALAWPARRRGSPDEQPAGKAAPNMNSAMVNVITNQFARLMKLVPRLKRTDAVTRDLFAGFEVAGYNYGTVRYSRDAKLHPDRVIVGTETVPGDIAETWALVEGVPNVIGDFLWSAWDYLGEAGLGSWQYGNERRRLYKPYPQLVAGCGTIDITGQADASLLHAQTAWGLLTAPAITVRPPNLSGTPRPTAWRGTDAVASWAWKGCAGRPAAIEVVSRDDEVELRLNGASLGRKAAGAATGNMARFTALYAPGEITAIAYRNGRETGRTTLRSAAAVQLRLVAERGDLRANGDDLAFVRAELADEGGIVEMNDDDVVKLVVEGPATLAGFGSAAPATEEGFGCRAHRTWRGRALIVLRAGLVPGAVRIVAHSGRHGKATIDLLQTATPGQVSLR